MIHETIYPTNAEYLSSRKCADKYAPVDLTIAKPSWLEKILTFLSRSNSVIELGYINFRVLK